MSRFLTTSAVYLGLLAVVTVALWIALVGGAPTPADMAAVRQAIAGLRR